MSSLHHCIVSKQFSHINLFWSSNRKTGILTFSVDPDGINEALIRVCIVCLSELFQYPLKFYTFSLLMVTFV